MTQGNTPKTQGLFNLGRDYCERTLPARSIFRLLYEHGDDLFPDEFFADLYSGRGRHSVPPRILATVMVLQRLGGLSDREAADRFAYDARWQYAAGGLEADYGGFGHTVLASRGGCFAQDKFAIDLAAGRAVCPAGTTAEIKPRKDGIRIAKFGDACQTCACREQCTSAKQ